MPDAPRSRSNFRSLHQSGTFILPNPYDRGSARILQSLGFKALATTSAGHAFSLGRPDAPTSLSREEVLAHIADIVAATDLPVNADFQSGYADDPETLAANVRLCIATGVAGLSIEDAAPQHAPTDPPLYDLPRAVERIAAARAAIDAASHETGADVLLTARAECYLVGHPDPLPESIRRLQAYAEAGADVLYAPGPRAPEDIRAIVEAVHPKPVNVLMSADIGLTAAHLTDLGVRRISLGSALARAAWGGFLRAVQPLAERGSFEGLGGAADFGALNRLFDTPSPPGRIP
jgi:2-methylisocitrate lyase-like PEP mutase family enzyme